MVRRRDKVVGLIVTEYLNFSLLSNFIWLIVRVFCVVLKRRQEKKKYGIGSLAVAFIIYLKGLKRKTLCYGPFFYTQLSLLLSQYRGVVMC